MRSEIGVLWLMLLGCKQSDAPPAKDQPPTVASDAPKQGIPMDAVDPSVRLDAQDQQVPSLLGKVADWAVTLKKRDEAQTNFESYFLKTFSGNKFKQSERLTGMRGNTFSTCSWDTKEVLEIQEPARFRAMVTGTANDVVEMDGETISMPPRRLTLDLVPDPTAPNEWMCDPSSSRLVAPGIVNPSTGVELKSKPSNGCVHLKLYCRGRNPSEKEYSAAIARPVP